MTVMDNEDPALPEAPKDPQDALCMSAFTILSRLQSGTEEVVRLDVALAALDAAVAAERERLCAALKIEMQHSAWDGVLQLDDALRNIADAQTQGPNVGNQAPRSGRLD